VKAAETVIVSGKASKSDRPSGDFGLSVPADTTRVSAAPVSWASSAISRRSLAWSPTRAQWTWATGGRCRGRPAILGNRLSTSSSATRPSRRAKGAPTQKYGIGVIWPCNGRSRSALACATGRAAGGGQEVRRRADPSGLRIPQRERRIRPRLRGRRLHLRGAGRRRARVGRQQVVGPCRRDRRRRSGAARDRRTEQRRGRQGVFRRPGRLHHDQGARRRAVAGECER
jgi:hypothetical protein